MSQSYNKPCRDCKQQITMMEVNGRWGAYNSDGSYHQCSKNFRQNVEKESALEKQQPLTLDQIDLRLKKVEKVLFQNGNEFNKKD